MKVERSLATILFTDIVGSTERAAELRDAAWRDLRHEHDRRVRRELKRYGGHEISTAGDSFLATFESPARAIVCADAIRSTVRELGLEVRAGLHMGEIERVGRDVGGLGVNIGARVAAEGCPGEILVSRTVHDALAGSAFDFEDRGVRPLKGVPGEWRLFAVTRVPAEAGAALPSRWKRFPLTRRWAWVGGAAIAALLLGGLYLARREPLPALNPEEVLAADAAPGIAVLPFTVNEPDLTLWREGMVDLLSVNLDGVPGLRAIDNRTILARWGKAVPDATRADLATALGVARATGARYALLGSVVAAGTDLRLTAEIYEARGGTKLGRVQVAGAPDSVLVLVDRLSMEVVKALPREEAVLADMDLAEVTTTSLDALKAFLNGEALYRRASFPAAAAEYERAIASDSTFALAWVRLENACGWNARSELCAQRSDRWTDEFLSRLPARQAGLLRAEHVGELRGPAEGIGALWEHAREYPDDPEAWYVLGDFILHFGGAALVDRADGYRALERAIALAPTTSAEPYIHLIERAFADADSARVADLLEAYDRITHGAGLDDPGFRLAFDLGLANPATRSRAHAALDTIPTLILARAVSSMGHPRLHEASQEPLRVLFTRPDHRKTWLRLMKIFYLHGKVRAELDVLNDPVIRPAERAAHIYRLYEVGVEIPPEQLERVLAAGAADTAVPFGGFPPTFLWVGAYAVDRGNWKEYAAALDRQRDRARGYLAQGDSLNARGQEAAAQALEGYALWKRGQKAEAIRVLEAAQPPLYGIDNYLFRPNFTVREWLGELMLEADRPRDAERYFKSLSSYFEIRRDPFVVLQLGRVYEQLGEFEEARASYEYALLSWQNADPELQPRIQEARRGLARLPKPIRRESP